LTVADTEILSKSSVVILKGRRPTMFDKLIAEARALIARLSEGTKVSPDDALHMLTVLCGALEDAEKQIPRWIPVTERLPEDDKPVNILLKNGRTVLGLLESGLTGSFRLWRLLTRTEMLITASDAVASWMPLPKGAEEEAK
jgi:hypothetical protein